MQVDCFDSAGLGELGCSVGTCTCIPTTFLVSKSEDLTQITHFQGRRGDRGKSGSDSAAG